MCWLWDGNKRKFFCFKLQVSCFACFAGDCFASSLLLVSYFDFVFLRNDKTVTDDWKLLTDYCSPSPDWNEKPCEGLVYFFLAKKSDQRKLFFGLWKKQQDKQACNAKRDWLLKKLIETDCFYRRYFGDDIRRN